MTFRGSLVVVTLAGVTWHETVLGFRCSNKNPLLSQIRWNMSCGACAPRSRRAAAEAPMRVGRGGWPAAGPPPRPPSPPPLACVRRIINHSRKTAPARWPGCFAGSLSSAGRSQAGVVRSPNASIRLLERVPTAARMTRPLSPRLWVLWTRPRNGVNGSAVHKAAPWITHKASAPGHLRLMLNYRFGKGYELYYLISAILVLLAIYETRRIVCSLLDLYWNGCRWRLVRRAALVLPF